MLETQLYGKLLPTHPDIKPKYELEIDWKAVHSQILERLHLVSPEN